jgi:hypothetical protein
MCVPYYLPFFEYWQSLLIDFYNCRRQNRSRKFSKRNTEEDVNKALMPFGNYIGPALIWTK